MHINTAAEHEAALIEIERLLDTEPALRTDEGEKLVSLAKAVEAYENIHHNIGEPTAEEAAAFRAEQEAEPDEPDYDHEREGIYGDA